MSRDLHLYVSLAHQSLELREDGRFLGRYPVSTSKFGPGSEEGSYCTPLGAFRICEKFGEKAAPGTIFRGRVPVGCWTPGETSDEDLVLTRILRLEGLDPDNANTYERYIYIHGTNHEELLGTPASMGCVRMAAGDLMELFDRVPLLTPVTISTE